MSDERRHGEHEPGLDDTSRDEDDDSLVDRLKEKVADLTDAPEVADYDRQKTNPVTGTPRDP